MGVNMAGNCIFDDEACRAASKQEVIRRYYKCIDDLKRTGETKDSKEKLESLLNEAGVQVGDRRVAVAALKKERETGHPAAAIELGDGTVVTGKTSDLLGASAACLLNALKTLAGIDHERELVSPKAIQPIQTLKTEYLGSRNPRLHTDEILIALSASVAEDEMAKLAMEQIPNLKGCEAHSTVLLSSVDESLFKRLGLNLTCEPKYEEDGRKYHKH